MESNTNKRTYWLDGFEGAAKGGTFSRSEIAVDVNRLESKFDVNIVAISIENDAETGKPSYNIEFITEVNEDEFIRRGNANES